MLVLALKLFEPYNSSLRVARDENDKYMMDEEIEIQLTTSQLATYTWYSGSHSKCIHSYISVWLYTFHLLAKYN